MVPPQASTPRQCVPVTEGGGFTQHLPDARSLRQAGQSVSACSVLQVRRISSPMTLAVWARNN
jgi:hypothetical protein